MRKVGRLGVLVGAFGLFAILSAGPSLGVLVSSGETQLTFDPTRNEYFGSWSPSGSRIALTYQGPLPAGNADCATINPDGTGLTVITSKGTHGDCYGPVYSPDGSRVLFLSNGFDPGFDLWIMNSDGSAPSRILPGGSYGTWSPDGQRIVAGVGRGGGESLVTLNPDGSGVTTLLAPLSGHNIDFPRWSPDGLTIAFHATDLVAQKGDIWIINADGSNPRPLLTGPSQKVVSFWSPDSRNLYVSTDAAESGNLDICAYELQTGAYTRLTANPGADLHAMPSPDGTRAAFGRQLVGDADVNLWVMTVAQAVQGPPCSAIPPTVAATVDMDPDTLNLGSRGRFVTAYIEIPGHDVSQVDIGSVRLNGVVPAVSDPTFGFVRDPQIMDRDGNGLPELMVKFSREAVQGIVAPGMNTLTITGAVNGVPFEGSGTLRVIDSRG